MSLTVDNHAEFTTESRGTLTLEWAGSAVREHGGPMSRQRNGSREQGPDLLDHRVRSATAQSPERTVGLFVAGTAGYSRIDLLVISRSGGRQFGHRVSARALARWFEVQKPTTSGVPARTVSRDELGDVCGDVVEDPRIAFAVRWAPHGGGNVDDIREQFGSTVPDFYRQVLALVDAVDAAGCGRLPCVVTDRVAAVARRRVWLGQ